MKKEIFVLLINGSPRKEGKTAGYLKIIMESVKKEGAKVQLLHLANFKILPCLGCYSKNPKNCLFPCKVNDDMEKIFKFLLEADALVFGSPSFWFSVPGTVKNFIDRLTCLENDSFLLEGKIFAAIGVAQETGGEEISHYLISTFNEMGCIIPPFATPFFNQKGKNSWGKKDLKVLGKNIVALARLIEPSSFH